MAPQLPTVTIDDLRQFHAQHFPDASLPENYLRGIQHGHAHEECDYEDEGLGYYEDGTERTLTDEQIAMFRHTEIQTILRQRRRRREEGKPLHDFPASPSAPTHQDASEVLVKREPSVSPSPDQSTPMSTTSDTDKVQSGRVEKPQQKWTAISETTRAKNAKNRNKNRKNHRARKKEEKKRKQQEMLEAEESDEWDPWHQAKGPDVQNNTTVDLEY
ncbi:hypothetical protein K458DRAFT_444131 [Lentithecium fluviatile CBS 122367]|uniref:Uncharacterized protein n=1 Tax=Lentithecium fluviatile CBS 122367 TaxID=1168545 RepID=A0A6G1IX61_9PLEO|nr:hypothetical protein K458DRAFT_444131 [Lentithecium fluviatile CBS 122367]